MFASNIEDELDSTTPTVEVAMELVRVLLMKNLATEDTKASLVAMTRNYANVLLSTGLFFRWMAT